MPDEPNIAQNPISEENSIPPSPSAVAESYGEARQEPMADAPILPMDSEPVEVLSEAPEASSEGFSDESNNIPPSNSTPSEAENEPKTEEKSALNKPDIEPNLEPTPEPVQTPEPSAESESIQTDRETAQIPVNEPLASKPSLDFAKATTGKQKDLWKRFLDKVQIGKRKKLEKIMIMFLKKSKITNDEVEKFLHVSDATATRYLSQLEKEGKIKQSGKTGKGVSYSRI